MATDRVDQDRTDPSEQIPEADLLEQHAALDPPLTDPETHTGESRSTLEPADEADRWEQQISVPGAEDDYPHESAQAGRS